ncbi:MAG: DUF1194 domain-containing protein [Hyphomicrobiales bacterium]|nr:DUF1194 domain-containing protein [Hyphomicrobiales bacterium]
MFGCRPLRGFVLALLLATLAGPAAAQDNRVDIELVIAVDVSWSMDRDEQRFQRDGYVAAFRHPDVIDAIRHGGWGAIAVIYVEWAGSGLHSVIVPWTRIDGAETANAFADALAKAPINRQWRTSISGAMNHAAEQFDESPYAGLRHIVDISGDGPNNQGEHVDIVRDRMVERGITINGLPLMIKRSGPGDYLGVVDLDIYYRDCVIGGTGAFMIAVKDRANFWEAIKRKLLLEIAGPVPRVIRAQARAHRPDGTTDCLIGEKLWREWREGGWGWQE